MIDDQVLSRCHRKNIFREEFNLCGIYTKLFKHPKRNMIITAITYAGDFRPNKNPKNELQAQI